MSCGGVGHVVTVDSEVSHISPPPHPYTLTTSPRRHSVRTAVIPKKRIYFLPRSRQVKRIVYLVCVRGRVCWIQFKVKISCTITCQCASPLNKISEDKLCMYHVCRITSKRRYANGPLRVPGSRSRDDKIQTGFECAYIDTYVYVYL